jgi:hypothetical protein
MELVRDGVVRTRYAHELSELAFERGVFVPKHFDLSLDERDRGPAADMRQAQSGEQRLVPLEKVRIVLQVRRNGLFLVFHRDGAASISCCHTI